MHYVEYFSHDSQEESQGEHYPDSSTKFFMSRSVLSHSGRQIVSSDSGMILDGLWNLEHVRH